MADQVAWEKKWVDGLTKAGYEDKNIFLDFFSPSAIGCQQMEAETYSDDKVAAFLNEYVVPIRIIAEDAGELGEHYGLGWTPHILVINPREQVMRMATGWFPPDELVPWAIMGMAMGHYFKKDWNMAKKRCQWILDDYPFSRTAPEAVYYRGLASTLADKSSRHLKELLATLEKSYPDSDWTLRAWPFSKI